MVVTLASRDLMPSCGSQEFTSEQRPTDLGFSRRNVLPGSLVVLLLLIIVSFVRRGVHTGKINAAKVSEVRLHMLLLMLLLLLLLFLLFLSLLLLLFLLLLAWLLFLLLFLLLLLLLLSF